MEENWIWAFWNAGIKYISPKKSFLLLWGKRESWAAQAEHCLMPWCILKAFFRKFLDRGGIWTQYLLYDAIVHTGCSYYQLCPQWCHASMLMWIYGTGFQHCRLTIGCQSNSQSNSGTSNLPKLRQNSFVSTTLPWESNVPFMAFLGSQSWQFQASFFENREHSLMLGIKEMPLFHSDHEGCHGNLERSSKTSFFKHVNIFFKLKSCCFLKKFVYLLA